jgi:hypothetical protein
MGDVTYLGWGGKTASVPDDFDLGRGHYRNVPAYGIRRAIWDAAFGYVNGFPKRAILYYVMTRSLSRFVAEVAMRREGVELAGRFGSLPLGIVRDTEDDS